MSLPGTSTDRRDRLCELFHAYDVDNSGRIEKREFKKICSDLGVSTSESKHIFSQLDTDRDGTINLEEFIRGFYGICEGEYSANMDSESLDVSSLAWEEFQTRMGDQAKFIPRSS